MRIPVHRRHVVDTAVQEGPVLQMGGVTAAGRATAAAGGAATASTGGAPRNLMAAAPGWFPASAAGAPSADEAPKEEGRGVGCATG